MDNHNASTVSDNNGDRYHARSIDWDTFCQRLDHGEARAKRELFERYAEQLVRLATRNIHPELSRRFDGEDVVQSVFRTFFRRQQAGQIRVERPKQLWRLLATITICKTRSQARQHTAECRDVRNEWNWPLDHETLDRQASPEDVLAFWEEIDAAIQGLPKRTAEIISCRLEGKSKVEIAREMDLSRQTVHRILRLVEDRLLERFHRFSDADGNI